MYITVPFSTLQIAMYPILPVNEDLPIFSPLGRLVLIINNKTSNIESVDETRMAEEAER